ncbi:MAG TPA: alkaline phosphatase, partial [Pilimelia sp.]|nr:alkaline phosphatase [Pilimelia sp.]
RGYVRARLTPAALAVDFRVVPYVSRAGAPARTRASFVVEDGRPGLHQTYARPAAVAGEHGEDQGRRTVREETTRP